MVFYYVAQTGLELTVSAFASQGLGFQAQVTMLQGIFDCHDFCVLWAPAGGSWDALSHNYQSLPTSWLGVWVEACRS